MIKNIKSEVNIIRQWALRNKLIRKVYIFGSFAKEKADSNSDLDIAIMFNKQRGDTDKYTTWICEGQKWSEQLQLLIQLKVHLEWYEPVQTPIIHKGIQSGIYLIYER